MSYISNNTRISQLTIAGVDYTGNFLSMAVSDSTANRNGCVQTNGTITLGTETSEEPAQDYFRNKFKRGDQVNVFITQPGGTSVIHPRGALYVISNSYDVESEQLTVEVGCRLSLMALTSDDEPSKLAPLIALVPFSLDSVQTTYSNCCAAISSNGQYVYQDTSRNLTRRDFWAGDNTAGTAAGQWVSVLGTTTNAVQPLTGTGAIPDQIRISYQVPTDGLNQDNKGRIDTVETTSYYFLQYPVTTFQRQNLDATPENPTGTLDNITDVQSEPPVQTSGSGACGNDPPPPSDNPSNDPTQEQSCNDGYALVQTPVYLPATKVDISKTYYDGPGAQVSRSTTEVYGPRLEANSQFFADNFAFCRQTYATACNFDGGCPYDGMDNILLGRTESVNFYGEANELVRTVNDSYVTRLSAAQVSDWRAGNVSGEIQEFDNSFLTDDSLFRNQRVEVEYIKDGNENIQITDTFTSVTARGVGVNGGQNIDALSGVKTSVVRKSSTIVTLDVQPDIINSPVTSTEERDTTIPVFSGRFVTPPPEAGPYVLDEQLPMPILLDTASAVDAVVNSYSNYLVRFTKGESFGLQISESLRSEVVSGYYPGMPFRYYDPNKDVLLAMRMDSTTWGVSNEEAAFVTSGLWNGVSNGVVTIPSNILGNSSPDMDAPSSGIEPGFGGGGTPGTPTPPPTPVDPDVEDETSVDSGTYAWFVDVNFYFDSTAVIFTPDGVQPPPPGPEDLFPSWTSVVFVSGLTVETGGLLETAPDGSIPLDYNGSLVTNDAILVDGDLFATA